MAEPSAPLSAEELEAIREWARGFHGEEISIDGYALLARMARPNAVCDAALLLRLLSHADSLLAKLDRLAAVVREGEAREAALRESLEFYADPDTYYGIAFIPDPPCGELMGDFEYLDPRVGSKPGKRAREALAATRASAEVGDGG